MKLEQLDITEVVVAPKLMPPSVTGITAITTGHFTTLASIKQSGSLYVFTAQVVIAPRLTPPSVTGITANTTGNSSAAQLLQALCNQAAQASALCRWSLRPG